MPPTLAETLVVATIAWSRCCRRIRAWPRSIVRPLHCSCLHAASLLGNYSTYLAYYSTNLDACVRRNLARLTLSAPSCIRFLPRPATVVALLPSGAHFETKAQCRLLRRSGGHLVTPWSYVDHRRRRAPTPLLRARLPCACATLHNRTSPSASPCQS